MKGILEHSEEMSRHIDLRATGEKLEALLKVHSTPALLIDTAPSTTSAPNTAPAPTNTSAPTNTLAPSRAATPLTSTPKTTPTPAGKRPSEESGGGTSKRRKVGEP